MLLAATDSFSQIVQAAAAVGAGIALLAFVVLIAWPAWNSYGRNWERVSALFLSVYVLVGMLGIGAGIGLAIFAILGQQV